MVMIAGLDNSVTSQRPSEAGEGRNRFSHGNPDAAILQTPDT